MKGIKSTKKHGSKTPVPNIHTLKINVPLITYEINANAVHSLTKIIFGGNFTDKIHY